MRYIVTALLLTVAASADTVTLRNGETIQGTYLGGTARQVRFEVGNQVRTLEIDRIQSLTFGDGGPQGGYQGQGAPPPPADPNYQRDRFGYTASNPPAGNMGITVPQDTEVTIRMIDSVNSERARLGETFRASVDMSRSSPIISRWSRAARMCW
jgi:hypothetical protein